jgi:hypothetical protein
MQKTLIIDTDHGTAGVEGLGNQADIDLVLRFNQFFKSGQYQPLGA